MRDAIAQLFASRKFIVMIVAQLALLVPAYFGKLNPDTVAAICAGLAGVWMAAHAHEEKAKIDSANFVNGMIASLPDVPKAPALPALAPTVTPADQMRPPAP